MYAMNIQNDVIDLVLHENCKSKQVTDFIAWPSRCHVRIFEIVWFCWQLDWMRLDSAFKKSRPQYISAQTISTLFDALDEREIAR
jgi:hypothetical protein